MQTGDGRVFPAGRQVAYANYARTAFEAAIRLGDLAGSRVLCPAFTCGGTFEALFDAYDMEPVFVDVTLPSMHMDREMAERRASDADVLLLVHVFGLPAEMEFWTGFAETHDLVLVEDCARALGATDGGRLVGRFGDYAFYSLVKVSPAAKGGVLVWDGDEDLDFAPPGDPDYYAPAAFGARNEQPPSLPLRALDDRNRGVFESFVAERWATERRENRRTAERVREELGDLLSFQPHRPGRSYAYLPGVVPERRDALFERLGGRETPVYRVWPEPWAATREPDRFADAYPTSKLLAERILHVPLQALDDAGIEFVVEETRAFYDA